MDARLRDGLTTADGQRTILVGAMSDAGGNEGVPRCEIERPEHRKVADAFLAKQLDKAAPGATHLSLYSSRHHVPAVSSMP